MNSNFELITPAIAHELLKHNVKNRKPKLGLVAKYTRAMTNGEWKVTHQGIAINCDGTLLDGQHRLLAVVASGVSVMMMVTRGVPSESQVAMDDHCPRSVSDALSLRTGRLVNQHLIAVAKGCVNYGGTGAEGNLRLSKLETEKVMQRLTSGLEFVRPFICGTKERGVTAAPVWSAVCLAYYYVQDLDRLSDFCRTLKRVRDPNRGDFAAITLRESLIKSGLASGGGTARKTAFLKAQRAIVAFLERQDIRKLYSTSTYYVWPIVNPLRDNAEEAAA